MARKLIVEIVGDASSYNRALDDAGGRTKTFQSRLGSMAKTAGVAAGAAGIGGLFYTLNKGLDDWTESTRVAAQTNAAIKSTGQVANVTARHVQNLATKIEHYSGIDDEAVKSGENVLLSFTKIRNEAGKGGKVFDRATKAVADFATRTGRDLPAAALIIGKALEDPKNKVTALARAGIVFTAKQRKMIAAMVDSGHTADAQRFILSKLEERYKGAAKAAGDTLPGQIKILKERFNDFAGSLVGGAIKAIERLVKWYQNSETAQKAVARVLDVLKSAWDAAIGIVRHFSDMINDHRETLEKIGHVLSVTLVPILKFVFSLWKTQMNLTIDAIGLLIDAVGKIISGVEVAVDAVVEFFGKLPDRISSAFTTAWSAVSGSITGVFTDVKDWVVGRGQDIAEFFAKLPGRIWTSFSSDNAPFGLVKGVFTNVKDWVKDRIDGIVDFFSKLPGRISDTFSTAWAAISDGVKTQFNKFKEWASGPVDAVVDFFRGLPGRIGNAIVGAAKDLKDAITGLFGKVVGWVKDALGFGSPSKAFMNIGSDIIDSIVRGVGGAAGLLKDAVVKIAKGVLSSFGSITGITGGQEGTTGVRAAGPGDPHVRIIALGRALQGMGFQVSENPAFGGVSSVHVPGSYHYQGRAIDVNWPGGGGVELTHLKSALSFARSWGPVEDMIEDAGSRNQHLHVALATGGIVTKPTHALIGERGPEAVIPLRRGGIPGGGVTVNVTVKGALLGSTVPQVAETIRRELLRTSKRNGGVGLG